LTNCTLSVQQPSIGPQFYVDGVKFWTPAGSPRDPSKLIKRLRGTLQDLGLNPSPKLPKLLIAPGFPRGTNVSLAPVWHKPQDLLAVVKAAEPAHVHVIRMELAVEFIGVQAELAYDRAFPFRCAHNASRAWNLLRVRGRTRKWGQFHRGTYYERLKDASRNLAAYADRPSKLRPNSGPCFKIEIRLQGEHLTADLRDPRALLRLREPGEILKLFAKHVDIGTPFASRTTRTHAGDDEPHLLQQALNEYVSGLLKRNPSKHAYCLVLSTLQPQLSIPTQLIVHQVDSAQDLVLSGASLSAEVRNEVA
jgi:hypothetical protein